MNQSDDSDLVSAHMQAYTRYLLENNLLLGQSIPPPQQRQQLPSTSTATFSQKGRQANLVRHRVRHNKALPLREISRISWMTVLWMETQMLTRVRSKI